MPKISGKTFAAVLFCSTCLLAGATSAQTVDSNGPTAGSTAKTEKGVTLSGSNSTAGIETRTPDRNQESTNRVARPAGRAMLVPKQGPSGAGNLPLLNGNESGIAPRADVRNATGPEGQAVRSADSTAHQTVYDPNNQLGTSVEGKTRPVPDR